MYKLSIHSINIRFEVVECVRRLMLSSMLILIDDGSASQVVVAIFICLVSMRVYSYYAPYAEDDDDRLADVAQVSPVHTSRWAILCGCGE